jgi:MinD superfamily P-loop ATPase
MILSIASGKGGTGKTTFATNLALSLNKKIQFLDCDVEEPNSNIFLKTNISKSKDVNVEIPFVDKNKCTFCKKCSEFCRFNALAVVPNDVLVFPELCHSCGGCQLVCPHKAIGYHKRPIGKIEHGIKNNIDFYQGLLNIGEIQAVPLIKTLKKQIKPNLDVILDSPPGTSCPVIETITGSDYCILVTEATPFGLHDLKLAIEVLRHMKIPFGVVINRDGTGFKNVEIFCSNEHIPVLMKIPDDENIARLYSNGVPFVRERSSWRARFIEVFEKIRDEVEKK